MVEKEAHIIPLLTNTLIVLVYDPVINQIFYCLDGIKRYRIKKIKVWSSSASADNYLDNIHLPLTLKYDRDSYIRLFSLIMKDTGASAIHINNLPHKARDEFFCGPTPYITGLYKEYDIKNPELETFLND